ncbi:MAG: c-type cytochrome [Gemmataceae bacterium]
MAGLFGLLVGCHKTETTSAPMPTAGGTDQGGPVAAKPFDADTPPHVAGKKALVANGCFGCHAVNGARAAGGPMGGPPGGPGGGPPPRGPGGPGGRPGGMMGGGRGPDLGSEGKDPEHSVDWIMKFVRDPKSVKPEARMPKQERISDEDLKAIADYLDSFK